MSTQTLGAPGTSTAPAEAGPRVSLARRVLGAWHVWIAAVLLAVAASPSIPFLLPGVGDASRESYEPIKTLRFFYRAGQDPHKWGPVPNFIYAPAYGGLMAYWKLRGDIGAISGDFPYGFNRPHEQIGVMLLVARSLVLLLGVMGVAALTWSLGRVSGSRLMALTVSAALVACGPAMVVSAGHTKPDGMMLAFAAAALSVYLWIVHYGLTLRTGAAMSLLAVCSISCKELTAPMFVLPYLGLGCRGIWRHRDDAAAQRRYLRDFAVCVGTGVGFYLLLNVVYAPVAYVERMKYVLGPLKDPDIWASSMQTTDSYLRATLHAFGANFGYLGAAMALGAVVVTAVIRPPHWVLLWLPAVSFIVIVIATAGYMPGYFIAPSVMTISLPLIGAAAALRRRMPSLTRGAAGVLAIVAAVVIIGLSFWAGAGYARANLAAVYDKLIEDYAAAHATRETTLFPLTLYSRNPGSHRLSYLGYRVDDRALYMLIDVPAAQRPQVLFTSKQMVPWLEDFKKRPARAKEFAESGFDYSRFDSLESLGYRRVAEIKPDFHWRHALWLSLLTERITSRSLYVYRLEPQTGPGEAQ